MAHPMSTTMATKAILICLIFCYIAVCCKAEDGEAEKSIIKSEYVNRGDKGYNFAWVLMRCNQISRSLNLPFLLSLVSKHRMARSDKKKANSSMLADYRWPDRMSLLAMTIRLMSFPIRLMREAIGHRCQCWRRAKLQINNWSFMSARTTLMDWLIVLKIFKEIKDVSFAVFHVYLTYTNLSWIVNLLIYWFELAVQRDLIFIFHLSAKKSRRNLSKTSSSRKKTDKHPQ